MEGFSWCELCELCQQRACCDVTLSLSSPVQPSLMETAQDEGSTPPHPLLNKFWLDLISSKIKTSTCLILKLTLQGPCSQAAFGSAPQLIVYTVIQV